MIFILIKKIKQFLVILKMHKIDKTKLSDQAKFRLYEIKKIENCFINDINQQKVYSKKLSRHVILFFIIQTRFYFF